MAFNFSKIFDTQDENKKPGSIDDNYYALNGKDIATDADGNGNKMVLVEPRAYSESQTIADYLKHRNSVVVNLKRVTSDQAKRIIDFLTGCIYAIGGDMQKLGAGIYLCTPNNITVQGKMTEGEEKAKKTIDDIDF